MWEIDYLTAAGALREDVARMVAEFLSTEAPDRAVDLMRLIESLVAPVSGGLAADAPAVVAVLVAGLPQMSSVSRPEALSLLKQIVGSIESVESPAATEAGCRIDGALPMIAALIETGTEAEVAEGIDLISMCSTLSRSAAERAVFYLAQIVSSSSGQVKASAERELDEVRRTLS